MSELPSVSILVPVFNEITYINGLIHSIIQQDYPPQLMEIIIIDGLSTDGTREFVREICKSGVHQGIVIFCLDNPRKIVPTGLNAAIRKAKGDILVRVDGHCQIAPDYVSKCVTHILADKVDGVGGSIRTIGENALAETIAISMSSVFGVGDSSFRVLENTTRLVDTVPFPAYTRTIIEKVGLYDEELVRDQDDEYNYRIREKGGRLLLSSDIKSDYFSRSSLSRLWKQYFLYGFYKIRVLQKHPKQMSLRQFVPPVFTGSLFISLLLSIFTPWGWIPLVCIAGSYCFANITASFLISLRKGRKHFPLLMISYLILHISYGLGFLFGLVRFWDRWGDKIGKVPDFHNSDPSI